MLLAVSRPRLRFARAAWHGPRAWVAALSAGMTLAIVWAFCAGVTVWTPAALVAVPLVALTAIWISGGAATALLGIALPAPARAPVPEGWTPVSRTAILVMLCKEAPEPLAGHLVALHAGLARARLDGATQIFVLSDTFGADLVRQEEAALHPLMAAGVLRYRRRARNTGRKPGNIAEWVSTHGDLFDHMLVLDADSRMTPRRIRRMIWQMEQRPRLGLLQAGIALRPGTTRLGRHQRGSARLLSRGFGRGFAAWSGDSSNYWGHNAIIRLAAFRTATSLPVLPGRAPFGGPLLSHDFIEAAWIRRAGWAVALDPDSSGSAEEAPQSVAALLSRDRRWCQGNLQHLRLLAEPGLDPVSRVHLAMGILSYIVAPAWVILVALIASGGVSVVGVLPLIVVAAVLLVPKLCALIDGWRRARTAKRRAVVSRAWAAELAVSSVIAPLVLLRQAGSVAAVCLGRDCGWKSGNRRDPALPPGLSEAAVGAGLVAVGTLAAGPAALWLAPVALPLCFAPLVIRVMDAPA
ncbi:glucans biosynthesis glucosyltransferase MdoH [Tropicimonas sp. IMCC6043]|uniref:glucans biosynthesis glucosyltransferase MdoH n=1 Tax=Tropicimonas sp. IMCC6043 TaxID=2510645 RepID=UPI00101C93F9|nr:glucans biosynthesis glucosyltransferase MdoH [Tropicimonas sp. IMCC6043]RYH07954.1 glucans biosynthesis glucosyltransferase MdoH [Tropicimonas sp. IMCC6043]